MTLDHLLGIFQGFHTLIESSPALIAARLGLIALGVLLIYLGKKGVLEPLLMIPMGLGMVAVNAGVLFLDPATAGHIAAGSPSAQVQPHVVAALDTPGGVTQPGGSPLNAAVTPVVTDPEKTQGNLFVAPLVERTDDLMYILQVDVLQPIYTFTFSNGLIACVVFMGIGALLDVGYVIARPLQSMFLALCAEAGTLMVFPIAVACGLNYGEAASIAMVGGADGPMVMFTALTLSKDLYVPITVVAYLYLGLTYGGYPYLIKLLVPKKLRSLATVESKRPRPGADVPSSHKLAFAVLACGALCLLFPVAAPLFLSLFVGVAVREAGLKQFSGLLSGPLLYAATFFLGLLLGILCEAKTILNPRILLLLMLGILALLLSGIGGILGGYVLWAFHRHHYNPVIGIAGVSCVPTTATVAQKVVGRDNPAAFIMAEALGANISGVITSAILCGIYVTVVPLLK